MNNTMRHDRHAAAIIIPPPWRRPPRPRGTPPVPATTQRPSRRYDRACACGRTEPECRGVLRDYYLDQNSPYPNPSSPQLFFKIANPPGAASSGQTITNQYKNERGPTVTPQYWATCLQRPCPPAISTQFHLERRVFACRSQSPASSLRRIHHLSMTKENAI